MMIRDSFLDTGIVIRFSHMRILLLVFFLSCTNVAISQDFFITAKRLFVPGGGKTGQEACNAIAKIFDFPEQLTYVASYPYQVETPHNPESGSCYYQASPRYWQLFNGGRCEKNWQLYSKYGVGGDGRPDPYQPLSESNPNYVYASYDLLCKRVGVDLAKNAGKSNSCPSTHTLFPIHIGTGNKYLRETDYKGAQGLHFERHYNYTGDFSAAQSQILTNVGIANLGNRWRGTYFRAMSVLVTPIASVSTVEATRDDGNTAYFTKTTGQSNWLSESDSQNRLDEIKDINGVRIGWTQYVANNDETEQYSAKGKLQSITKRNGLIQTIVYSDGTDGVASGSGGFVLDANGTQTAALLRAGLPLRVVDSYGRHIQFGYDVINRLVKLVDAAANVIFYSYDPANNNLLSITYPDGKLKQYLYNESAYTSGTSLPNALTGIVDENGIRFVTYTYDANGRAIDEFFPIANNSVNHYQLQFDASGLQSTVTDPLGTARTYNFTNVLGVLKLTGQSQPGGAGCGASASAVTYDPNGNVASRTDFNGTKTTFSYDLSRNLETSRTEAFGTPQARTTTTSWHPTYRLPTMVSEPLRKTTYAYDGTGNLLSKSEHSTTDTTGSQGHSAPVTGTPRTWTYTYNQYGQVLSATGPRTDVADITTYSYDAATGNLLTITNAAGQTTTLSNYDANGRVGQISDANGTTTDLTYHVRGWLTSKRITAAGGGNGQTTSYSYDGVGQLTQVTLPDNASITYTYDDAHRLTTIADSLGNQITYTLDAMGNRISEQVKDPQGTLARQTTRIYDALNRLQTVTGAAQ